MISAAVRVAGAGAARRASKRGRRLVISAVVILLTMVVAMFAMSSNPASGETSFTVTGASDLALREIPPQYLQAYQRAGAQYGLDWAMLAGSGWIESQHGNLRAVGVRSGVNAYGCCAGPAQFNITGAALYPGADTEQIRGWGRRRVGSAGHGTWGAMAVDGDGDGWLDVWDPDDAIMAMARYYRHEGAPADWARAVRIYSGGNASYLAQMRDKAEQYRGAGEVVVGVPTPIDLGGGFSPLDGATRLTRLVQAANQLQAARLPYCYGGGHGITPAAPSSGQYCWAGSPLRKVYGSRDRGLDCSSSVSWLLQRIGYRLPTMTSGMFASWGKPGPGAAVTIWTNAEHVYLEIKLRGRSYYFGTSTENYRHGPGWHSPRSGAGFVARHPEGL